MEKIFFPALFLLLFLSVNSIPLEQINAPPNFVGDFYGTLSIEEKNSLENRLKEINSETGIEIGVAIINSTDGKPIEQLAWEIGNKWKIGKKEFFNGVLILVAIDDREWFIATAKGIEGALPDIITKRIGENNFSENFRNGNYFEGIYSAAEEIEKYALKDPQTISNLQKEKETELFPSMEYIFFWGLIILITLVIVVAIALKAKGKKGLEYWGKGSDFNGRGGFRGGWSRGSSSGRSSGGGFGGGGGFSGGGSGGKW